MGTPRELKSTIPGQDILTVEFLQDVGDELLAMLKALPEVREAGRDDSHIVRLILQKDVVPLEGIMEASRTRGNKVKSVSLLEPTLEDVFIHYTGRGLRDTAGEAAGYKIPQLMR